MKTLNLSWLAAGAVALIIVAAAVGRGRDVPRPGDDVAEGGSPLYRIAVTESVTGLVQDRRPDAAQKAAPCPKCGKVHGSAAAHASPVSRGDEPESSYVYCPKCKVYHRRTAPPAGGLVAPPARLADHPPHPPAAASEE